MTPYSSSQSYTVSCAKQQQRNVGCCYSVRTPLHGTVLQSLLVYSKPPGVLGFPVAWDLKKLFYRSYVKKGKVPTWLEIEGKSYFLNVFFYLAVIKPIKLYFFSRTVTAKYYGNQTNVNTQIHTPSLQELWISMKILSQIGFYSLLIKVPMIKGKLTLNQWIGLI